MSCRHRIGGAVRWYLKLWEQVRRSGGKIANKKNNGSRPSSWGFGRRGAVENTEKEWSGRALGKRGIPAGMRREGLRRKGVGDIPVGISPLSSKRKTVVLVWKNREHLSMCV